jgi:hypothetical protein
MTATHQKCSFTSDQEASALVNNHLSLNFEAFSLLHQHEHTVRTSGVALKAEDKLFITAIRFH